MNILHLAKCPHKPSLVIFTGNGDERLCLDCDEKFSNIQSVELSSIQAKENNQKLKKLSIWRSNWINWEHILGERIGVVQ